MLGKSIVLALPLTLVAALLVAALAGSAPAAQATRQAAAAASFTDARGDSGAAPDITAVDVGNDVVTGPLVFWVTLANRTELAADDSVVVFLDTDRNATTGSEYGEEYAIVADRDGAGLMRWDGTGFVGVDAPSLDAFFSKPDRAVRLSIHPRDLGDVGVFDFWVFGFAGEDEDAAPDNQPLWTYEPAAGPLVLSVEELALFPRRPTAGRTFVAALAVARHDTNELLTRGKIGCTLLLGKTKLRTSRAAWVQGIAVCSWKVPAAAKGRLLRGTISVTYGGATAKRSFSPRVR